MEMMVTKMVEVTKVVSVILYMVRARRILLLNYLNRTLG